MKLSPLIPVHLIIYAMVFLVPFSYFEVNGIRVVVFVLVLFFLVPLLSESKRFVVDLNFLLFTPLLFCVFLFSLFSGSSDYMAVIIFSVYLLFFNFLKVETIKSVARNALSLYVIGAAFMAVGVIVQRVLFETVGFEFGKIDFYGGGRVGFGFIWTDYSFLSLYILTAVPIVFYLRESVLFRVTIATTLVIGSVLTTARTGLAGLLLTSICIFIFMIFNIFKCSCSYFNFFFF